MLGERIAAVHLEAAGYKVLYRNFRGAHGGELDIVCRHRDTLVFVEVKTRTTLIFGRPAEAVTESKQRLILRGANEWLRRLGSDEVPVRYDIVEVLLEAGALPCLGIIQAAFGPPGSMAPTPVPDDPGD